MVFFLGLLIVPIFVGKGFLYFLWLAVINFDISILEDWVKKSAW